VKTSGTKGTPAIETIPATAAIQAKAVTQAVAVTQATSNNKDDSTSMTASKPASLAVAGIEAGVHHNDLPAYVLRKKLRTVIFPCIKNNKVVFSAVHL
jgi:hypothetical protein